MKTIKLLGIFVLIMVLGSASIFAAGLEQENNSVEITGYGVFRYFKSPSLSDEAFEFYFSIDTCTEMVSYLRIKYPYQSVRQDFDILTVSSDNGEIVLELGHAWSIDQKFEDGKRLYKGVYDDTVKDIYETLDLIEILKGENVVAILSDYKGNTMELSTDESGLRAVASEYMNQRDSFSKIWR